MTDGTQSKKPKRHIFIWIVVILVILGAGVWIFQPYQIKSNGGRHANDGSAVPVVAALAHKGEIDITREGLGTVTPLTNITVRTQINGQLMQIAFEEGQIVQQGDFLAQIDPRPYQMALEQAEGALQRDQALLVEAQLIWNDTKNWWRRIPSPCSSLIRSNRWSINIRATSSPTRARSIPQN